MIEVADGRTSEWFVEPGQFGLAPVELERVAGGTPRGERRRHPPRAGRGGRARIATSPSSTPPRRSTSAASPPTSRQGVAKAAEAIDSGAAANVLERLIAATAAPAV